MASACQSATCILDLGRIVPRGRKYAPYATVWREESPEETRSQDSGFDCPGSPGPSAEIRNSATSDYDSATCIGILAHVWPQRRTTAPYTAFCRPLLPADAQWSKTGLRLSGKSGAHRRIMNFGGGRCRFIGWHPQPGHPQPRTPRSTEGRNLPPQATDVGPDENIRHECGRGEPPIKAVTNIVGKNAAMTNIVGATAAVANSGVVEESGPSSRWIRWIIRPLHPLPGVRGVQCHVSAGLHRQILDIPRRLGTQTGDDLCSLECVSQFEPQRAPPDTDKHASSMKRSPTPS